MRKIIKSTAYLMAAVLLLSSCASIVSKTSYPIAINSTPSEAQISVTDKKGKEIYLGKTPAAISLASGAGFFSKAEYQVKFSLPGYDTKVIPIAFKLDGWYWGNILIGGLLGMIIVDPATGAMWKLSTEFLNERLTKSPTASIEPEFIILDVNNIPEHWKDHLEIVE
jgi:hypothetical protein